MGRLSLAGFFMVVIGAGCGGKSASQDPNFYKEKSPEAWLEDLKGENEDAKVRAIQALKSYGAEGMPALATALEKGEISRTLLLEMLGRMGQQSKGAVPTVVTLLEKPDLPIAEARKCCEFLGIMGPHAQEAFPAVKALWTHDNLLIRMDAIYASAHIASTPEQISTVVEHLKGLTAPSVDQPLRLRALEALFKMSGKTQAGLPICIECLGDQDPKVADQARAILNMAQIGAHSVPAVPELVVLLDHGHSEVRLRTAYALMWIGPEAKDALPKLKEKLAAETNEKSDFAEALNKAIESIEETDKDKGKDKGKAKDEKKAQDSGAAKDGQPDQPKEPIPWSSTE
jgi:hypothetical protein